MKPVDLVVRAIKNSSKPEDIILDLFRRKWYNVNCCRTNKKNLLYDGVGSQIL